MNNEKNTEVKEQIQLPADLSNAVVNYTLQQFPDVVKAINSNVETAGLTLKYFEERTKGLEFSTKDVTYMVEKAIENLTRQDAVLYDHSKAVVNSKLKVTLGECVNNIFNSITTKPALSDIELEEFIVREVKSVVSFALDTMNSEVTKQLTKTK